MHSKHEKKFIKKLLKYKNKVFFNDFNSVAEGFEYLNSREYKIKKGAVKNRAVRIVTGLGLKNCYRLAKHMWVKAPSMFKNISINFNDMEPYLQALECDTEHNSTPKPLVDSYPNDELWVSIKDYVWDKYRLIVGFTEIPLEYIFKNKAIPFKYALVFAEEMNKEAINKAPELEAGLEVANVYNSLGIATNEINNYLRTRYGIVGMANHPLGGLVDFIPLAEKAGLGKIGKHGLLITKEFGPRCRISPIFIDKKIFKDTATKNHDWINKFCESCGNCIRNCPENAIYEVSKHAVSYNREDITDRHEAFDREKCYKSFSSHMGCSICIKSCPFSNNPNIYSKLSIKYNKEHTNA